MAATDVLTLEAAKEVCYRSAGDTRDDVLLAAMVTALSDRLDRACGPIVQRAVAGEAHDGGCGHIQLRLEPVASVTSIVEWHRGAQETLTAESNMAAGGYLLTPWTVPDPAGPSEDGVVLAISPARTVLNLDLVLRIMDVQAFLRYEDASNKDPFDIPGYPINGPRILYGVKWHFWN